MLKPDVDLRRTVGWFTTVYPVALPCATGEGASAKQLLDDVHDTLNAVPHYGIGYGLLRYLYAPTAPLLGAARPADIFFSYLGTIPDLPSLPSDAVPVQFDADTAMPVRDAIPGLRRPLHRTAHLPHVGTLYVGWWYDTRKSESATTQTLAHGFTAALMELTREALAEDDGLRRQ